jgi:baseplate J-like protein
MTTPNTQNYSTLVSNQVAAIQSLSSTLINFLVGSILRAIVQANATVALWLQGLILTNLTVARLASSTGTDVDSFYADFPAFGGRLGAVASIGPVTFFRNTPTIATVVPVGTPVASADGTQIFTVIADTTNVSYSAAVNGYPIAIGIQSVNVTVQAQVGGTGGNVSAGGISILQKGVSGVDTVSNASAFTNGVSAESDAASKVRFQAFFASLGSSSVSAIQYAITSLNQNLQVTIVNQPSSTPQVAVTVDDGSGAIPTVLVTAASVAANAVVAAGISIGVTAASKLNASVNMTITTATGYTHSTVVGQVALALTAYINAVGLGNTVSYMQLAGVAFAISGVTDVTNVTLNSGTADLVPTLAQTYKALTIAVS